MKKKIVFFVKNMPIGGVERQLCYLLKGLNKEKYDISLILCKKKGEFLKEISPHINISDLSITFSNAGKLVIAIKLFYLLRRNKPDIFISFHVHLNSVSVLVCRLLSIKVFCCFPGYFYNGKFNFIRKIYLNMADKLIAVSDGVRDSVVEALNYKDNKKIVVIKNVVDYENIVRLAKESIGQINVPKDLPLIITMGRLAKRKGFDILINATVLIKSRCRIVIIGDGPEKTALEKMVENNHLTEKVIFLGAQLNPYKYLKMATLFVLASESEGLPTVILEAKSLGIPCISSDYYGGVQGVVNHMTDGYVFKRNDIQGLAFAIDSLLSDYETREKFSQEGIKQIRNEFNFDRYINQYEDIFDGA